jgi:hypothetical protein
MIEASRHNEGKLLLVEGSYGGSHPSFCKRDVNPRTPMMMMAYLLV